MKPPSAIELLDLWEDSLAGTPARRGLALLTAMYPGVPAEQLASLTIGQRDTELLRLREMLLGHRLTAIASCPECRQKLELGLDTQELLSGDSLGRPVPPELSIELAEYSLDLRLPTTLDLLAAEAEQDAGMARSLLLDRCLLAAQQNGSKVSSEQLPDEVITGIAEAMAEADPLSDIQLKLKCPGCGHSWRAAFDIVSFLWAELDAWARRLLSEVHVLAAAYGWSEREIVTLSPARRSYYLEMVSA